MKKILLLLSLLFITNLFSFEQIFTVKKLNQKISKGNVIIEFYEDWCPNCPIMTKNLKSANLKNWEIYKVKLSSSPMIHIKYNVQAIPAVIFFKDGKVSKKYAGVLSVDEIKEIAKEVENSSINEND